MSKKYVVDLAEEERKALERLIRSGKDSARRIRYAQALLKADSGWTDRRISEAFPRGLLQLKAPSVLALCWNRA